MKAIVVDDERHTRIFLQTVFDWHALGVTEVMEADNGETALQLIFEHRPELILTDMRMPGKDGVRLLQALTELDYPHRKIVISGYDEYDYMKTAIAYGGFDYFIKPIDEEEVFNRLAEAVRELDAETSKERERQAMEARLQQIKWSYWDDRLSLCTDRPDVMEEHTVELEREFSISLGQRYRVVFIPVNERLPRIRRMYGNRIDLLYYSLQNCMLELLGHKGAVFRYLPRGNCMVLWLQGPDTAEATCEAIHDMVYRLFRYRLHLFASSVGTFPDQLGELSREAMRMMEEIDYSASCRYVHIAYPQVGREEKYGQERVAGTEKARPISLLDDRSALEACLYAHSDAAKREAERLVRRIGSEGAFTQKQIELWNEELQWLRQNRRERAAGNPTFEYGCLNAWSDDGVFSEAAFADSLYRHLRYLQEQAAMEREDPVAELERHLREHYASFQTIDELAKLFHMHPLHLSRLFRKKYHIGIKEFVQKLRIEHAKNLLHQSDLRIGVISSMVGYQDEKYFSRVFRQAVGVSPNQYRQ